MTPAQPSPEFLQVWRFVRGDMSPQEFEHWVCSNDHLEQTFNADFYLDLISADYRDRDTVDCLKQRLGSWARDVEALRCKCITLPDLAVVDMFEESLEVFKTLQQRASRGDPFWWLSAYCCSICGDWWLVAQEERQNAVFCMRRLRETEVAPITASHEWRNDFDRYEEISRIGLEASFSVRFIDSLNSSSLRWTIQDLANVRPGIRISEVARLLNLDIETASALAHVVVQEEGVTIDFDVDWTR